VEDLGDSGEAVFAAKANPDPAMQRTPDPGLAFRLRAFRLLELGDDVVEQRVQAAGDGVNADDDSHTDAGGDQAILDGRGARLVSDETCN
jgi:hypothetical protein